MTYSAPLACDRPTDRSLRQWRITDLTFADMIFPMGLDDADSDRSGWFPWWVFALDHETSDFSPCHFCQRNYFGTKIRKAKKQNHVGHSRSVVSMFEKPALISRIYIIWVWSSTSVLSLYVFGWKKIRMTLFEDSEFDPPGILGVTRTSRRVLILYEEEAPCSTGVQSCVLCPGCCYIQAAFSILAVC